MTDRNRNIRAALIFFAAIGMLVAMPLLARAHEPHFPIPPEPGTPANSPEHAEYWAKYRDVELNDAKQELADWKRQFGYLAVLTGVLLFALVAMTAIVAHSIRPLKNFYVPLIAFALLAPCRFTYAADVIDMTINGDLADIQPSQRVPISMHVWDLRDPDHLAYSVHWKDAEARAKAGQMVVLDIEPMQAPKPEWKRPTIPLAEFNGGKPTSLEDVRETHRLIGERLEPVCVAAIKSGAPVYDYMTYQIPSLEMWVSRHAEAVAVTEQLVKLTSWKGKSNVARMTETGGGVLVEVYVPTQWNTGNFWMNTKAVLAFERLLACYERLGVRVMPLLYPYTVGGPEKEAVRPDLMNALILAARGRYGSRWGFYNETFPLPPGVKELLK